MVEIMNKEHCCGCSACYSVCPTGAIVMKPDEEGFLYPCVESSRCINCGLCEKVCPILNEKRRSRDIVNAYIGQNKDANVREASTSGGVFSAVAMSILKQNGVVYGAAFDKDFAVNHIKITCIEDLYKLRGSKYVQSDLKDTFIDAKKELDGGRKVCFSGTPCQIGGLISFLNKEYHNLITIDVACHAVPSPLIWEKYLEYQRIKLRAEIAEIQFRHKKYGYKYSAMTIKNKEGKILYSEGVEKDQMLRTFFSDICDRPSCYSCKFKNIPHASDITIWDCFTVRKFNVNMDDDLGTSRILVNSQKGAEVIGSIEGELRLLEVDSGKLVENVHELFYSVDNNRQRQEFLADAISMDSVELFEKYFPIKMQNRVEGAIRVFLAKTGLYTFVKERIKQILGVKEE